EVEREIGRGSFGIVYAARAANGDRVAVKLLRKLSPEARARFERERRLLEGLGGVAGVVPIVAHGSAPEGLWLAMPFLEGGTLSERLGKGPLGIDASVALVLALARALERA